MYSKQHDQYQLNIGPFKQFKKLLEESRLRIF